MDAQAAIAAVGVGIALLALVRPEIGRGFRRFRNRIDLFPLMKIEVGFSSYGPTLGLVASVRSTPNDQFIRSMSIRVTRERDSLSHTFDWAVFRPSGIMNEVKDFQVAAGFTIRGNDSRPVNIQFWDNDTRSELDAPLARLLDAWRKYLEGTGTDLTKLAPEDVRALFQGEFNRAAGGLHGNVFAEVGRKFYWEAGSYRIQTSIDTWDPQKTFSYKAKFDLSESDAELLRLNVISVMLAGAWIPVSHFNFVNPIIRDWISSAAM